MSTIRRRKPKFEFAQLLNAVLRDYRVSWRARGLLAELLSYPPDYETNVDELVKRAKRQGGNVEGREAMRKAARELKAVGYIIEIRHQDEAGKWSTDLEVTDDPMYELLLTQDDSASPGQSDAQKSGVGSPGVGSPGVPLNTETNTERNTSPPDPPQSGTGADPEPQPGGEDEDFPQPEPDKGQEPHSAHTQHAQGLIDTAVRHWPSTHRAPGVRDRQRLAERVATELDTGGEDTVILDELTRDLSDAGSALRVLLGSRTREPGWGHTNDPRPDATRYEPTGPTRPPWCGVCDERTRHVAAIASDGSERMRRCRQCHPHGHDPSTSTDTSSSVDDMDPNDIAAAIANSLATAGNSDTNSDSGTPVSPGAAAWAAARQQAGL